jgi:4-alpha-glucanotransferase
MRRRTLRGRDDGISALTEQPRLDPALAALVQDAGVDASWEDAFGKTQAVLPETLRAVLEALGLPARTDAQIRDTQRQLRAQAKAGLPPLLTAVAGQPIAVKLAEGTRLSIVLENGGSLDVSVQDGMLPAVDAIGYHAIEGGGQQGTLAVAPARALSIGDLAQGRALWGLAAQLYSLRHAGDGGVGDFTALEELARAARRYGADAVAVSPIHALFAADPRRFSPYAPSSRLELNWLHVDTGVAAPELQGALIDWPAVAAGKRAALTRMFATRDAAMVRDLAAFRAQRGEALERHARFEALQAHLLALDATKWHWRTWPAELRDPDNPSVAAFAAAHEEAVTFHAFLQFQADLGLARTQAAARGSGMRIGLISDLAVGTDSSGSHCWSRQQEMLLGLSVGAPPDLLARQGQDWGLTAFSPRGLRLSGYRAFLEMLRAALRHAGGVRIDHAMGLARLWVLPSGAQATEGAYLRFPVTDQLRLVALESVRHGAVVLGEDLGTVPPGFSDRLVEDGIAGLRVLFFERVAEWLRPPHEWTRGAAAMTSTHDLPPVAGWWEGRDIELRDSLGLVRDVVAQRAERERDRRLLWQAFRDSGAALNDMPGRAEGQHAAGSAVVHVGKSACRLALVPLEDVLALREQPNLPGTTDEHPNWRRRMPGDADALLGAPAAAARLSALERARHEAE